MENPTPPNTSGFDRKPKTRKRSRSRKSKNSTLEHKVLTMELRMFRFLCNHFGGKNADWFLGCISIIMMADSLRSYFDTDGQTTDEQTAV